MRGSISDGYKHFDGHTEIYATYTHTKKYTMMLAHHDLRVVHVSTHVSLREACDRVKKDRVLEVIEIADRACRDMGIAEPKVAVAGLNPHSGEKRTLWKRGDRGDRPRHRGCKSRGHKCHRPGAARFSHPRGPGRLVRHSRMHVPRSGTYTPQDCGLRI